MSVLEAQQLKAGYGRIEVLHGLEISVNDGEAVTIIGSNGAGKTTLLKTLAGLLRSRGGTVQLGGQDVTRWTAERRARSGLALVPEGRQIFPGLSVRDNLQLGAFGHSPLGITGRRRINRDIDHVFELFPRLQERANQAGGTLSGGEQQMLAIGRALMSRPRVLLLDEPSLGLAPLAIQEVTNRLQQLVKDGTTIILVEQNAAAAFAVAQRGYVIDRGSVVAADTVANLRNDPVVQEAYLGSEKPEVA